MKESFIRNLEFDKDGDLGLINLTGIAFQIDISSPIDYNIEYFNKYISYENSVISNKINAFRVKIANAYCNYALLDIGVGSGEFLKKFGSRGIGFDINPIAIKYLKSENKYINPYIQSIDDIDCITFFDSLEHIPNPDLLLKMISIGSKVIISIPIFENLLLIRKSKHYRPSEHFYYFTRKGIQMYMFYFGFQLVEMSDSESRAGRENIETFVFKKVC